MLKGLRFRIYPNKMQQKQIQQTFGCCRYVYNQGLAFRQEQYECGNPIGYNETWRLLYKLKHDGEHNWLKDVDTTALQQCLRDLDKGYKNFFNKIAKYPKFKSKHNHNMSYRTNNGNYQRKEQLIMIKGNYIKLPKLGYVKAKITYNDIDGVIKNATISQVPSGKYFVSLCIDYEDKIYNNNGGMIGLDVGIKDFCIDSNGNKIENPKYLSKSLDKLKKEHKKLSKKKLGSKNWDKQRIKVARDYEHITNQRNDLLQKLSTTLVRENQIICVEDLNVSGMVKNHKLARSISDVSWSKFFDMLDYKAYSHGTEIIKVPRFYASSQICSNCSYQNTETKDLSVRKWICPKCGTIHDRDINAAINIIHKGLEIRENELR